MPKLKGQALSNLSASALAVIILVIVVAVGATVLQSVRNTQTSNTTYSAMDYNITNTGLSALETYSDFFSVIVVVIVFAVIIGLFAMFTMRDGKGGI